MRAPDPLRFTKGNIGTQPYPSPPPPPPYMGIDSHTCSFPHSANSMNLTPPSPLDVSFLQRGLTPLFLLCLINKSNSVDFVSYSPPTFKSLGGGLVSTAKDFARYL